VAVPAATVRDGAKTGEATRGGDSTLSIVLREAKLFCVFGSTALVTPTFDLTTLLPMCAPSRLKARPLCLLAAVSLFLNHRGLRHCLKLARQQLKLKVDCVHHISAD